MSMEVKYSVDPSSTSGGLYQRVTTSLEKVFEGTDFARARPTADTNKPLICKRDDSRSFHTVQLMSVGVSVY